VILTATNVDIGAFGWGYVAGVVGFVLAVAVFCAVGVWLLDRAATRHLHRKVNRARRVLANGDSQVLRAVEQREHSHRVRHQTVPKQLAEKGTRR
jgi:membrane carboxypeptidase/penicillin-binding protein PbpC